MALHLGDRNPRPDGRTARRERGRISVIDAMFELVQRTNRVPSPEELANHSGVSVASIYRYFATLEELQMQTYERFGERFGPWLTIANAGEGDRASRIEVFIHSRIAFYNEAGTLLRVARSRILEQPGLVASQQVFRQLMLAQVIDQFAPELRRLAAEAPMLLDTVTSPESWDVLHRIHEMSEQQIVTCWVATLRSLLEGND